MRLRKLRSENAQKLDDTIGYQEWLPFFAGIALKKKSFD